MARQVYACSSPFLFFFKVLLKAYLFDAVVVLDDERIPFALILSVLTSEVVTAQEAALKVPFRRALSVLAGHASTVQTHRALCIRKPLQPFSKLLKAERFDYRTDPLKRAVSTSLFNSPAVIFTLPLPFGH